MIKIVLGIMTAIVILGSSPAFGQIFSVDPNFPNPKTVPHVEISYENGYLVIDRIHEDSVFDVIRDGVKTHVASESTKFVMRDGCYVVAERTEFTWEKSNELCKHAGKITNHEKFADYVEKRFFYKINEDVTLIVLPKQTDMAALSACPQSYDSGLLGCYRNYRGDQYIISSWETISKEVIEHEMKHVNCNCNFHEV